MDVPRQRNNKEDNATIKAGALPIDFAKNKSRRVQKDIDARWTIKNKERHYGYKNHINADTKTNFINYYPVTPANCHDSVELKNLVAKTDHRLYADSAY